MKLALALLLATPAMSVPLASCATVQIEDAMAKIERFERGIDIASEIADRAFASGIISAADLAKFRSAVSHARNALAFARAAVAAGDKDKLAHWLGEAKSWLDNAASGVPEAPEAVAAEMARGQ